MVFGPLAVGLDVMVGVGMILAYSKECRVMELDELRRKVLSSTDWGCRVGVA